MSTDIKGDVTDSINEVEIGSVYVRSFISPSFFALPYRGDKYKYSTSGRSVIHGNEF